MKTRHTSSNMLLQFCHASASSGAHFDACQVQSLVIYKNFQHVTIPVIILVSSTFHLKVVAFNVSVIWGLDAK